jgi:hypothetical protein
MIAKACPSRKSGRGSFSDLREYLERANGIEREDYRESWSSELAGSHETIDLEMERVAAHGRCKDPVYHVALSWRPGEDVSPETMRGAVAATLRSVGAEDHQWYAAAHYDSKTERHHVHLVVNKVHPETYKAFDRYWDAAKLARAAEWVERQFGCLHDRHMDWREFKMAERDFGAEPEWDRDRVQQMDREAPRGLTLVPPGAGTSEMDAARRAGYSWAHLVRDEAAPAARTAGEREGATWEHVHAALETYGLRMEAAGSGARVVGAEPGLHLKASRVGLDIRAMEQILGPFVAPDRAPTPYDLRLEAAREVVAAAQTWTEFHDGLKDVGFALEANARGGQLVDLEHDGRKIGAQSALGMTLPKLEKTLGEYEMAPAIAERNAREYERRAEGMRERVAILLDTPEMLVGRIAERASTWDRQDVAYAVRDVLNIAHDENAWDESIERVVEATFSLPDVISLGQIQIDRPNASADEPQQYRELFTTREIASEERILLRHAQTLHTMERREELPAIREPSAAASLNEQQRAAYEHIAQPSSLAIVQGIAGAGKSRLMRDVAAAYTEAGYRVVGAAVAGSAAQVFSKEAEIEAQTVARLIVRLNSGQELFDPKTVLFVDEASMLGTEQAMDLLLACGQSGATLRLLGDADQHGSVARGTVLEDLSEKLGCYDMQTSRRAKDEWLREVAGDLRAGIVPRALGTLREHGCIAEYATADEAKARLVADWSRDIHAGRDALLTAVKRVDVAELNELARATLTDRLGEARPYMTAFGEREIAVGEVLVVRHGDRASETVNGDRLRVLAHRDYGRIACERLSDGAKIVWNTEERPEFDYGYASTSYGSQGRTVDDLYKYVGPADDRTSMYVGVTRAHETLTIAHGRDEVPNFSRLLDLGSRDHGGLSVVAAERAIEASRRERELKIERVPEMDRDAAEPTPEPEIVQETTLREDRAIERAQRERSEEVVSLEVIRAGEAEREAIRIKREAELRAITHEFVPTSEITKPLYQRLKILEEMEKGPEHLRKDFHFNDTGLSYAERRLKPYEWEVKQSLARAQELVDQPKDGFLGLFQSREQKAREQNAIERHQRAVQEREKQYARYRDPEVIQSLDTIFESRRAASEERREVSRTLSQLRQDFARLGEIGITEIEVRRQITPDLRDRVKDAQEFVATTRETRADDLQRFAQEKERTIAMERERREIERQHKREYGPDFGESRGWGMGR